MAATQRPLEGAAISTNFTGTPAWKSTPSWALVARADNMISPDGERFMAERAQSHVVAVDASYAVAVSQPDAVTDLIVDAAHSVNGPPAYARPADIRSAPGVTDSAAAAPMNPIVPSGFLSAAEYRCIHGRSCAKVHSF